MKSIAAYYAFVATNSLDQEAAQRRASARVAAVARPSLLARARALLTSNRPAQRATTSA